MCFRDLANVLKRESNLAQPMLGPHPRPGKAEFTGGRREIVAGSTRR